MSSRFVRPSDVDHLGIPVFDAMGLVNHQQLPLNILKQTRVVYDGLKRGKHDVELVAVFDLIAVLSDDSDKTITRRTV